MARMSAASFTVGGRSVDFTSKEPKSVEIGPGEEAKDDTVNGDTAPRGDGAKAATVKNNGTATKPTLN